MFIVSLIYRFGGKSLLQKVRILSHILLNVDRVSSEPGNAICLERDEMSEQALTSLAALS